MGRTRSTLVTPLSPAIFAVLLGLASAVTAADAQIKINEILPNPPGDDVGTERVEIYNAGAVAVDMTGWAIDDAATIDMAAVRCRIPEDFDPACGGSVVIGPGEFRVIKGQTTAAWLNQGGDDVYLMAGRIVGATQIDHVTYAAVPLPEGQVWSSIPNGSNNFAWRSPNTLCASNAPLGDVVPPGTVSDLSAVPGAYPGEIVLTWTAPGDDGMSGTASLYEIRVSNAPINSGNFAAAADLNRWIQEPVPAAGGSPETVYIAGMSPDSTYYFALRAQDEVPNTSAVSNSPGTAPFAGTPLNPNLGFNAYFGNLHSHTSYSDGVQTPAQAYNFARFTAPTPLDFLAVTDHNHVSAGMMYANYGQGMAQADAANQDGQFVAIYGQEWGLAANGHLNIFQAPGLFGWDAGNYDWFVAEGDYASLYTAILAHPPVSYPPIAEWNHPTLGDFNGMAVTPDARAAVHLMCLVNGPATSTSTTESDIGNTGFDDEFGEALRKGMRVSPTADQDNHNATWGASSEGRTAVLALEKTKSAILGAMAERRTYATQDHNAKVDFNADGHPMGTAFASAQGVRFAVQVTDPDPGDAVAQIDLYRGITGVSSAVIVASDIGSAKMSWREHTTFADGTEAHYYFRIRMADNQNIWTGPVYVTYNAGTPASVDEPGVRGLDFAIQPNPSRGATTASFTLPRAESRVSLVVFDLGGRRVRDLAVGALSAGQHHVTWDGRAQDGTRASAGLYFLRLDVEKESVSRKLLLMR